LAGHRSHSRLCLSTARGACDRFRRMCNHYRQDAGPQRIMELAKAVRSDVGNLAPGDVYPDYSAPIIRIEDGQRILAHARWGLPSPQFALEGKRTDKGVTNVRNLASPHWRRWQGLQHRCLVPFTSFSEPSRDERGNFKATWFVGAEGQLTTPAFFAGIWVPQWTSVRKLMKGPETIDLFGFLTTAPSEPVKSVHPKAMPVILRGQDEIDAWLCGEWPEVVALQRALPDGALTVLDDQ